LLHSERRVVGDEARVIDFFYGLADREDQSTVGKRENDVGVKLVYILISLVLTDSVPSSVNLSVQTAVGTPGNGEETIGFTSSPCFKVRKVLLGPFPQAAYICGVSAFCPRRFTTCASVIGSRDVRVSTRTRFWRGRGVKNA